MQRQRSSPPTSVFCAAAPSDTKLLAQWEKHLLPLQQAGYLSFWSERHVLAGLSRLQQIHDHLEQADLIFLLISADFFADETCYTLMECALERQQHGVRIIPLLLHPVVWQISPLASLYLQPSNGIPVTMWPHPDAGFHECIESVCILLGWPLPLSSRRQQQLNELRPSYPSRQFTSDR